MAKLLSTIIDGFLASKNFISGALGSGWKIWKTNGRYKFEVDDVVVRNTMTVFELLISKIRSVKGALGITQASGKIKSVREDSEKYYIQIEDEMSFVAHDIVKCQTFSSGQKNYWVIVDSIKTEKVGTETVSEIVILKSEFEGASIPETGDEIVQFGNTTDVRRQSAIYLHADENGVPAVDVLFEITGKSFDGCTKVRLGGALPGEAEQFKGLYCENGLLKGLNENGDEVYKLRPDGSGFVAKGNISWKADGSGSIFNKAIYWDTDGFHFGSGIKLTWDNLDDSTKENLKGEPGIQGEPGEPGKDTNLLPWVEEWNGQTTQIGSEYVVSPKMFSGTRDANNKMLNGVAFGRGVVTVIENGIEKQKTGIFGLKNGNITFSIDAETGDAFYEGTVLVKKDANNFVKIYHNGPGDWGVRGVINGDVDNPIFQLGSTNKVGKFTIRNGWFLGETISISDAQVAIDRLDGGLVRIGSLPGESTSQEPILGYFRDTRGAAPGINGTNAAAVFASGEYAPGLNNNSVNKYRLNARYSIYAQGMNMLESISTRVIDGTFNGSMTDWNWRVFLHHNPAFTDTTLSNNKGYEGQVITVVNSNFDNQNLIVRGFYQFRNDGSVIDDAVEITDGGAEVSFVKYKGRWFFLGRSGNVKF